jgi:hypothetical protein
VVALLDVAGQLLGVGVVMPMVISTVSRSRSWGRRRGHERQQGDAFNVPQESREQPVIGVTMSPREVGGESETGAESSRAGWEKVTMAPFGLHCYPILLPSASCGGERHKASDKMSGAPGVMPMSSAFEPVSVTPWSS